jgi:hypothetical protein
MTYFHVFWTKPHLSDAQAGADQEIEFWDFEALTWLVSALEARRLGPLRLITDTRGLQFARKAGLEWLYNGGISTVLDEIPAVIRPDLFWAAGKLYAYRHVTPPCVCLDTDAILWQALEPAGPVQALHEENRRWPYYQMDQAEFSRYGFNGAEWNWELHPFNTGIVCFEMAQAIAFYAATAIRFMENYSRLTGAGLAVRRGSGSGPCDPMVFAEQRLLPLCMDRLGLRVTPMGRLHPAGGHLVKNPTCTHLWSSKAAYKCRPDARLAYVNYLIEHVERSHPEARATLAGWKLDQPRNAEDVRPTDAPTIPTTDWPLARLSLLKNVKGVVWIEDANVNLRRRATEGSLVWAAEVLRPEAGASFDLMVAGQEGVSIRQAAQ